MRAHVKGWRGGAAAGLAVPISTRTASAVFFTHSRVLHELPGYTMMSTYSPISCIALAIDSKYLSPPPGMRLYGVATAEQKAHDSLRRPRACPLFPPPFPLSLARLGLFSWWLCEEDRVGPY